MTRFRASAGFTDRWDHFDLRIADRVATITFARPERLNALTFEVYADLRDLLAELPHRDDVHAVVLRGTGRGFCSGGDVEQIIGELRSMDARDLLAFTRMTGSVVQRMREIPLPVVAGVNGVAAGAGAVLAIAADLRVVARSARFAFLFTRVGLAGADMGAAYLLPRLIGAAKATELLLLGETVDAEAADRLGLVTALVADDELVERSDILARRLADGPAFAHAATKTAITREQDMSLPAAIELEAMTQALLLNSGDHREFYRAHTEDRAPRWSGR